MHFLLFVIMYSYSLFCLSEATKAAHWTDFVSKKNDAHNQAEKVGSTPSNDSHKSLNEKSKFATKNPLTFHRGEIPIGHSERARLTPLVNQRIHHDQRVNEAMIGGIILHKDNPLVSHVLLNYAHEQRSNSQGTQRAIDHVKAEGHIDQAVVKRVEERKRKFALRKERFRTKHSIANM